MSEMIEKERKITNSALTQENSDFLNDGANSVAIDIAKEILGSFYQNLLKFFYDILFGVKKNTCTVIIARRCLVIEQWFLKYFEKEHKNIIERNKSIIIKNGNVYNYIVSDKLLVPEILNKVDEVVIVDDILIHGRQVLKVENEINKIIGKQCVINKKVFMCNYPNLCEKDSNIEFYYNVSRSAWDRLSHKFVKLITRLNIPYVSYLNSYTGYMEENEHKAFIESLSKTKNFLLRRFSKDVKRESYFIALAGNVTKNRSNFKTSNASKINITDTINTAFLRYYYCEETKIAVFIPYVILNRIKTIEFNKNSSIEKTDYGMLLEKLLKKQVCRDVYEIIKELFNLNSSRDITIELNLQLNKFLYNLLSCVYSFAYGEWITVKMKEYGVISEKINSSKFTIDYYDILSLVFGSKIKEIITNKENYLENLEFYYQQNGTNQDSEGEKIKEYLKNKWYVDELNAILYSSKSHGETVSNLICNHDSVDVIVSIIEACDKGEAHIDADCTGKFNESVLSVGELGYRFVKEDKQLKDRIRNISIDYKYLLD